MDFKTATDALFERVTHEDLAAELGVSVAAIRQARLAKKSMAYRGAPKDWERAIRVLAEGRIRHYNELLGQLAKDQAGGSSKTRWVVGQFKLTHYHPMSCSWRRPRRSARSTPTVGQ